MSSRPAPPGYLSPAVHALTRLHAVEPSLIAGTGADGRVMVADVLAAIAPARDRTAPVRDCTVETEVDVTAESRAEPDVAAAVRLAVQAVRPGHTVVVSANATATRSVPPLPANTWAAVTLGAPFWTAAAAATADGERVLTARRHRTVVVRLAVADGHAGAESLLSAAASAVGGTAG
jgi:pyruvate/2-oxoglutarate dehydrogenase complex dihydrolipoamide acyltransferase (E2) component